MSTGWGPSVPEVPLREHIGFGSLQSSNQVVLFTPAQNDAAEAMKRWPPQGDPTLNDLIKEALDRQ